MNDRASLIMCAIIVNVNEIHKYNISTKTAKANKATKINRIRLKRS